MIGYIRRMVRRRRVERALAMTHVELREVFMLAAYEELTYSEIAERLGISVEEVERRLAAALVAIDRALTMERP